MIFTLIFDLFIFFFFNKSNLIFICKIKIFIILIYFFKKNSIPRDLEIIESLNLNEYVNKEVSLKILIIYKYFLKFKFS